MENERPTTPLQYKGVMVSSTFTDLEEHRAALIKIIKGQGLTDVAMENDSAKPDLDVIESSLQMVRDSSAYIGVISRKYGQTPKCPRRNPGNVSITELEFDEAQRLNRPVLLFIMGEKHPLIEADVESNATKKKKLNAFRKRAKLINPDSQVHRVYATFKSLDEFKEQAARAVSNLRRHLEQHSAPLAQQADSVVMSEPYHIPSPPALYAEPPYIGSHEFLGRGAQLDTLNDWASRADRHPILLFEAIGGAGKSLLAWEWTTNHSTEVRSDWAGRFWYSFYERGAIMADFCARALVYITGRPLSDFRRKKTAELGEILLHCLQSSPWLLVLDGLERVLVAYHRFDAAQLADREVDASGDTIAQRDPCAAIRPEDDDLLRALAAAAPSKIVVTTRLTPRILLNAASQPVPGVLRVPLTGLRPADAEALLRACGVTGASQDIQDYLKRHYDCHPLVTGVLAGLINDYLPDRGNFDAWVSDPEGGGRLNLADLDLVQKRNHILHAALAALPDKSRQLLSTLAIVSESVDYPTLSALNPHLPPVPGEVKEPKNPEDNYRWGRMSEEEKEQQRQDYRAALVHRKEYEQDLEAQRQSREFLDAPRELVKTVRDLERRGLLQYDAQARRYDLHPVVRGISAGGLRQEEKEHYGQRVVDHFSQQSHAPFEQAESLEDLSSGLHVTRALLQMGRLRQAASTIVSELSNALLINLEAYAETLSLIRPLFPKGWATLPDNVEESLACDLATSAYYALSVFNEEREVLAIGTAVLVSRVRRKKWHFVCHGLADIASDLSSIGRLGKGEQLRLLAHDLATALDDKEAIFRTLRARFSSLITLGQWEDAETLWNLMIHSGGFQPSKVTLSRAWIAYANLHYFKGDLSEEQLNTAEGIAKEAKDRAIIRNLYEVRGSWHLERCEWDLAADNLSKFVRMTREVGLKDEEGETKLALAMCHLGQLRNPRQEAEQLAASKHPFHYSLAKLWLAIGELIQAKEHALKAYEEAWADGEPYVYRSLLNKTRALLEQLGVAVPELPEYDPFKDETFPWEEEVRAAIKVLRAKKEVMQVEKTTEEK